MSRPNVTLVALGLIAAVVSGAGCATRTVPPAARAATTPSPTTASPLSMEEIGALTIPSLPDLDGQIRLIDGVWEGSPHTAGGAARPRVVLVDLPPMAGDLDGDGTPETAVLLAQSAGGTGVLVHLAVVERTGSGIAATSTAAVGDRVQIRGGHLDGSQVVLDLVQAGPEDAMCCPGDLATRTWALEDGSLQQVSSLVTGRLTPEVMADAEWVLTAWNPGEPAIDEEPPTLRYGDGRLSGFAGCNRYFAEVVSGPVPGDLSIGPIGATKMFCEGRPMEIEDRFLAALGAVDRVSFFNGRLALGAVVHGTPSTLLFEAHNPGD